MHCGAPVALFLEYSSYMKCAGPARQDHPVRRGFVFTPDFPCSVSV